MLFPTSAKLFDGIREPALEDPREVENRLTARFDRVVIDVVLPVMTSLLLMALGHPLALEAQSTAADAQIADAQIADALRAAGLRPVEPPTPAADGTLRSIDGRSGRISDSHGRWLLLTFVASWCGPCVQEMPTLDAVAQSELSNSVDVVGISIDRDGDALEAFLGQVGVGFPVFWDPTGALARIYRARSIPLTYVIDPHGHIRGVARGARDWSALGGLYQLLIAGVAPFDSAASDPARDTAFAYSEDVQQVELPIRLTPPDARVVDSRDRRVAVGEPFEIEIEVTWAGNFDEYLLHPPRIVLPEGIEQLEVAAETSGEGGDSVVTYRVSLEAKSAGVYALDPVELRYTPRGDDEPLVRQIDGIDIEASSPKRGLWLLGGLGALVALVAARWVLSRRGPAEEPTGDPWQSASERLRESSVLAVKGDAVATLAGLLEVVSAVRGLEAGSADSAEPLTKEMEDLHQRCQFAGETLTSQELGRIHRRVERWFTDHAPSAAAAERERLEID